MTSYGGSSSRYLLGEVLGRGTTGTVYRAHDRVLDRPVALKEITHQLAPAAVLAEARAAARVSHHNVVIIHDVLEGARGPIIAMELVDGPTLAQVLLARRLNASEAFKVAVDIAAALQAAHASGVVHCDVKPDNIFVTSAGRVVVTDFGLANPDLGGGTPGYMAPEQYDAAPPAPTMDVFGWGAVCVELFCGLPPFGQDPAGVEHRTRYEQPSADVARLAAVSGLDALVLRCLEKSPTRRLPDGSALLTELAAITAASPPTTVPSPRPARLPRARAGAPATSPSPPAPVVTRAARLVVFPSGGSAPWFFDVRAGERIEVGREATLVIADVGASRRHAYLAFDGYSLTVTDLGSTNGTHCNGIRIYEHALVPGDVLTIGSTLVKIEHAT